LQQRLAIEVVRACCTLRFFERLTERNNYELGGANWEYSFAPPKIAALGGFLLRLRPFLAAEARLVSRLRCKTGWSLAEGSLNHRLGVGREQPHLLAWLPRKQKQFETLFRFVGMEYRYVATSVAGFVQQLVSCYLPHGYWFYVSGMVPKEKDPRTVDLKLLEKYGIAISRQSRARRKAAGMANVHYIRYQRRFLLVATHGHHPFFEEEDQNIRDARSVPIKFAGYSISVAPGGFKAKSSTNGVLLRDTKWRVRVQIEKEWYTGLKAYLIDIALVRSVAGLAAELHNLPFEPYAPVRQQLLNLIRYINQRRASANLERLSFDVLRYRRRIVKPFERVSSADDEILVATDESGQGFFSQGGLLRATRSLY
jgi:hypothetical protein